MSLGLNDLNKKKRKVSGSAETNSKSPAGDSSASTGEKFPAGTWARTHTTKPWSSTGLKASRHTRKALAADAAMNDEWASVHAPPIFWFELAPESRFYKLQEKLAVLEDRVQKALCGPVTALRTIYKQVTS